MEIACYTSHAIKCMNHYGWPMCLHNNVSEEYYIRR